MMAFSVPAFIFGFRGRQERMRRDDDQAYSCLDLAKAFC
jgi:hypothetical protein